MYNHFDSVTLEFSKKDPLRIVRYVCLLEHLWFVHRQPKPSDVELSGLVTISIGFVQIKQLHDDVKSLCSFMKSTMAFGSLLKITLGAKSEKKFAILRRIVLNDELRFWCDI